LVEKVEYEEEREVKGSNNGEEQTKTSFFWSKGKQTEIHSQGRKTDGYHEIASSAEKKEACTRGAQATDNTNLSPWPHSSHRRRRSQLR
jgi:hypothetical protein